MKTKKFKKKLSLNKKTISNLANEAMSDLKAGAPQTRFCTAVNCWLYETGEFQTCDCTYYCTDYTNCYNCNFPYTAYAGCTVGCIG